MALPSLNTRLLSVLANEKGGLIDQEGEPAFSQPVPLLDLSMAVTAGAGSGMNFLLKELVVQALIAGRCVRILDFGGGFRRFAETLEGVLLRSWSPSVWCSPDHGLVVLEIEDIPQEDWPSLLVELDKTPPAFWFLATEAWVYEQALPRADCLASLGPVGRRMAIIGKVHPSWMPRGLTESDKAFLSQAPDRTASQWLLLQGDTTYRFQMTAGPERTAAYTTRNENSLHEGG